MANPGSGQTQIGAGLGLQNWNQWWGVGADFHPGKAWDPNVAYVWQAQPEWYEWNGQNEDPRMAPEMDAPATISTGGQRPDSLTLLSGDLGDQLPGTDLPDVPDEKTLSPPSILKHLQEDPNLAQAQDDEILVGEIRDAVASFLAGGDMDSDEEGDAESEMPLSADAPSFVPMKREANCEYLVSTMKRVGLSFSTPSEQQVNNFLDYMRGKPLPETLNEELSDLFHQEIRRAIDSSYANRICPTLSEVEMCFAELPGEKEGLEVKLILTMCAKRCPETYHILPPDGRGRQAMIFLAQAPEDFTSFLDPERDQCEGLVEADWDVLDEACKAELKLSHELRVAARELQKQHFQQKPLAEVSNLLHLAIGKGKLAAWEDSWLPKDVVDSLEAQRQERIKDRAHKQGKGKDGGERDRGKGKQHTQYTNQYRQNGKGREAEERKWQQRQDFAVEQNQWPSLSDSLQQPPRSRTRWNESKTRSAWTEWDNQSKMQLTWLGWGQSNEENWDGGPSVSGYPDAVEFDASQVKRIDSAWTFPVSPWPVDEPPNAPGLGGALTAGDPAAEVMSTITFQ